MTSAPRPPASPSRPINAVFPCVMPRSAPSAQAAIPGRKPWDRLARLALAAAFLLGFGALDDALASARPDGAAPGEVASSVAASLREQAAALRGNRSSRTGGRGASAGNRLDDARHGPPDAPAPWGDAGNPRAACLAAARQAEAAHGIPPGLMVAVALAESGLHAHAMSIGGRSYFPASAEEARRVYGGAAPGQALMAGCVQVNARVHARGSDWPLDPWRAADWGAGYLRTHYERSGNWADALRRWNGGGTSGNRLACRVQAKLAVANPASTVLSGVSCGPGGRERREGAALLEIAETAD